VQDRDLAVDRADLLPEVLRLAGSAGGAQRDFFLAVLYLVVGDAVRTGWRAVEAPLVEAPLVEAPLVEAPLVEAPLVEALLADGERSEEPAMERWAECLRDLFAQLEWFDHAAWCEAGLARKA
jgi:hypothetical protein